MPKCVFVDRDCIEDCVAYDSTKEMSCLMIHMNDRTNKLLNFIEKKIDKR